jgi:hypothetical protein
MVEVGIAEYFGMAEAIGIVAAVFVVMYYSRKQTQALSVDIETKVLNDLEEEMHAAGEMMVHRPELVNIVKQESI